MEGCQCTGYWEKLILDPDEDGEIAEYDWEVEHDAEED